MVKKKSASVPSAVKPKADRLTRVVILMWTVAGALLLTTVFRVAKSVGFFSFVSPMPGVCRSIPLPGPGDLAYEPKSHTLFIAADGLYALTPGAAKPVKLAGASASLHAHAVSVGYDLNGAPSLAVVDKTQDGAAAVELYDVAFDASGLKLTYQSTIQGGLARRGDGVAALGNGRFYLTSNPTRSDLMAWADRWLLLGRADLLFFNGMLFREAVNGLSDPSAVAISPDGSRVFIASRNERRLIAFSRDALSGIFTEQDSIGLPMRPERLSMDAYGNLWAAGPARLPAFSDASVVARIVIDASGKPQSVDTVYADDGQGIKAATAAVKVDNHLFIGSSRDNKLLDCAVK